MSRRSGVACFVGFFGVIVCGCVTPTATHKAPGFDWHITLLDGGDVDVGAVETRVCFRGPPPHRLGPENKAALSWLADLPHETDRRGRPGGILDVDAAGIVTDGLKDDACVSFVVDVEAAARAIADADVATVFGRAFVGSPDAWLWRPEPWIGGDARLVVDVAGSGAGLTLAVPFPRDPEGGFVVAKSTFALQSFTALGRLETRLLEARGARFHITRVVDGGIDDATVDAWLKVAIDDVAVPLGRFPVDDVSLLLVPVQGKRQLLSGFLGRGGGASALYYLGVGPFSGDDDPEILDEDGRWVFTHELAHTLLPPVARGDGWLNEGVTTWHQEVLPAAAGRRGRDAANAQLAVGFNTGAIRAKQDGLDVETSCRQMDARGSYQHCYWSGARLTALLADAVGDDGVFALVRVLHDLHPLDSTPLPALSLLREAAASSDAAASAAATTLLALWEAQKSKPFPTATATATTTTTTTPTSETAAR